MPDVTLQTISNDPGSYLLWLYLPQTTDVKVGKLGTFTFRTGNYFYLGSAHGPGGLRARLSRHLRGDGKLHWHVDYLRAVALVRGFGYMVNHSGDACVATTCAPTECEWSQRLTILPRARIVVPGFGASDCQSGCAAHLVYLPNFDPNEIFIPETEFPQTWFTVHN